MISEHQDELLAAHALDALSPGESPELKRLLAGRREYKDRLRQFRDATPALGLALWPVTPSPAVRDHLLDTIDRLQARRELDAAANSEADLLARPAFTFDDLLPWVAVFLLATTSAWLWLQNTRARSEIVQLQQEIFQPTTLRGAVLLGQNPFSGSKAEMIFCTRLQKGRLFVHGLRPADPGHVYQIWLQRDPNTPPVSGGTLQVGGNSEAESFIQPQVKIENLTKVMVSLEPAGPSDVAKGPVVLSGGVL